MPTSSHFIRGFLILRKWNWLGKHPQQIWIPLHRVRSRARVTYFCSPRHWALPTMHIPLLFFYLYNSGILSPQEVILHGLKSHGGQWRTSSDNVLLFSWPIHNEGSQSKSWEENYEVSQLSSFFICVALHQTRIRYRLPRACISERESCIS